MPPRLRWYVLAVSAAGLPVAAGAVSAAARSDPGATTSLGIAMFCAFALVAELRPVPLDPAGRRDVSLAFVFIISAQLLFGWEWSVLAGALGIGGAMAVSRHQPMKIAFNASTYAIAAGAAAVTGADLQRLGDGFGYGGLVLMTIVCGAVFVAVNVVLVCIAIGLSSGTSPREVFSDHLHHSGPIFGIMIFVAAQATIFWRLSPALVFLLGGPLVALTLYQRSYVGRRTAEEEAATDSLTALKNRRAFEEEAERSLAAAARGGEVALCLMDIDHFKQVNDRHGHPTGDAVLSLLAGALEEVAPGCGYRLGGDELALLLVGSGQSALDAADSIRALFAERQAELLPETVTISAGVAAFPEMAEDLHSLVRNADLALYRSKNGGRARSTLYAAEAGQEDGDAPAGPPLVDIRLLTARRLASLVDAFAAASADARGILPETAYADVLDRWQSFDNQHSEAVASMCVALGRRLGLTREELDQVHLAGLLHDIGKIAVPTSILSKPGPLTVEERDLIERHSLIGYELLRDLGLAPVDKYVLHHHERWDGNGYPAGLAGAEIPLGSRLILVADAFDALTSDRAYRNKVSIDAAMHELQGEAGRQLDPLVVAALHDHLAQKHESPAVLLPEVEASWSS